MATFQEEEKSAFRKIVALSSKDQATVRDVLFGILTYATIESFNSEQNEIVIPYLCTLNIKYKEIPNEKGIESFVTIDATPSNMLLKEFLAVKNGEEPITKRYFKKQNRFQIKNFLKNNSGDIDEM